MHCNSSDCASCNPPTENDDLHEVLDRVDDDLEDLIAILDGKARDMAQAIKTYVYDAL